MPCGICALVPAIMLSKITNVLKTSYSARDCGPLAIPRNGSSIGNRTTFPNEIAFVCDDGFILVGSTIRVCHENGTWSGNQTFCKGRHNSRLDFSVPPLKVHADHMY